MVQFASYLRLVLCKRRLIFPRINGPNDGETGQVSLFREDCEDQKKQARKGTFNRLR